MTKTIEIAIDKLILPGGWRSLLVTANVDSIVDGLKLGETPPPIAIERDGAVLWGYHRIEAYKQIELAQRALKECDERLKPDQWLKARTAMLHVYEEGVDWDGIARRVETLSEEERDQVFERESQRILGESRQAFISSLKRDAGYDAEQIARFDKAYERATKYYDITSQVGGHGFEIYVTMPGTIVASNADKTEDDGSVKWEFDGKAFRDRPYEVMVTSRLPLDRDEK